MRPDRRIDPSIDWHLIHTPEVRVGLQEYQDEAIRVTYDAEVCQHAAECVKGLPQVFNGDAKPWIQLANGDPTAIAEQVKHCPSGALQFEMLATGKP